MEYNILKYIHILSATLLFGTGLGTAFFMWMAYFSKDIKTLTHTTKHVILADWFFTTPTVIIQPLTGIWLMIILHYPFNSLWFALVIGLYVLAGLSWIIVVFIQYRLHNIIKNINPKHEIIPREYHMLMRWWLCLGVIAFSAIMVIYWLMVAKDGLGHALMR
ncbi:MAG: DUF2269 domain-containing protein [Proteobacteria bacterium]|nr:DUF2269 domain-containing protein [Pseudomonadota bacterium]